MEIFKLFGSIFVDSDEANASLSAVDDNARRTGDNLGGMIGKVAKWGVAIGAAVGGVAVALGVKAVSAADELKKAMDGLAAETGATKEEMSGLEDSVTSIYNQNFGESFEDIATAMANVKKTTGLAGEELESTTKTALLLRDTFGYDVAESVNTVNSLMTNFGITADEAYTLIAQGAQMGADKNGDLLDTLNEYSGNFAALGLDANEFTDTLIQGAINGSFSIDKVGDAVKEFSIRSKDGSKTSAEGFAALGLNADEMFQTFAQGGPNAADAFQTVIQKLGDLDDPLQQNIAGVALFGTQWEDLGVEAIKSLGDIDDNADMTRDTLDQINDVKYDSFGEAIAGIGRNFETGLLIPLGEKILPKLQSLADWVVSHMPEIQAGFETAFKIAGDVIGTTVDAVQSLTQFFQENWDILQPILLGIAGGALTFGIYTLAINAAAIATGIWTTVTGVATAVGTAFGAVLAFITSPIGLVVIAIGLLVAAGVLLYKNWDTVKEFLSKTWTWVKDKAVSIFNSLKDFFIKWGPLILAILTGPIGLLVLAIVKNWDSIKESTVRIFESIKSTISGIWDSIVGGIKGSINLIIGAINGMIRGLNKIKVDIPAWVEKATGMSDFGVNIKEIPYLKDGTDFFGGGAAIVGEQGPELVNLPRGSKVTPNRETQDMIKSAGKAEYIQTSVYLDGKKIGESVSRAQYNKTQHNTRSVGLVT